jgi:hypothetical protein
VADVNSHIDITVCENRFDRLLASRSFAVFVTSLFVVNRGLFFPYYFAVKRISARQEYLKRKSFWAIFDPPNAAWKAFADIHGQDAAHKKFGCISGGCYCVMKNCAATRSRSC